MSITTWVIGIFTRFLLTTPKKEVKKEKELLDMSSYSNLYRRFMPKTLSTRQHPPATHLHSVEANKEMYVHLWLTHHYGLMESSYLAGEKYDLNFQDMKLEISSGVAAIDMAAYIKTRLVEGVTTTFRWSSVYRKNLNPLINGAAEDYVYLRNGATFKIASSGLIVEILRQGISTVLVKSETGGSYTVYHGALDFNGVSPYGIPVPTYDVYSMDNAHLDRVFSKEFSSVALENIVKSLELEKPGSDVLHDNRLYGLAVTHAMQGNTFRQYHFVNHNLDHTLDVYTYK